MPVPTTTLDNAPRRGIIPAPLMRKRRVIQERIRRRILARLEELGMTQRELSIKVTGEPKDSWISGILSGAQGLSWKDFDAVCDALTISPSEMVRHDDDVVRELTPSEMRMMRHFQTWPSEIQTYALAFLDHLSGSVPDRATATLLARLRQIPRSLRAPTIDFLIGQIEGEPLRTPGPDDDGRD